MKFTHAILLIAACYVAVLNLFIVDVLWRQVPTLHAAVSQTAAASPVAQHSNLSHARLVIRSTEHQPARCGDRIAVALWMRHKHQHNFEVQAELTMMSRLKSALRFQRIRLFLLVSIDTFQPFHRTWCMSAEFPCEILVLKDNTLTSVANNILSKPCADAVLLLENNVSPVAGLANALQTLPRHEVLCLSQASPTSQLCPLNTYLLPWNFLRHRFGADDNIAAIASLMNMLGSSRLLFAS